MPGHYQKYLEYTNFGGSNCSDRDRGRVGSGSFCRAKRVGVSGTWLGPVKSASVATEQKGRLHYLSMGAFSKDPVKSPLLGELETLLVSAKQAEMGFIAETEYRLESRIAALTTQNARLIDQSRALSEALDRTRLEFKESRRATDRDLAELLRDHEVEVRTLKSTYGEAAAKSAELIAFLRSSLEENRGRIAELEKTTARIPDLERDLAAARRTIHAHEERVAGEDKRTERIRRDLEDSQQNNDLLKEKIASLVAQSDRVCIELGRANARVAWFEEMFSASGEGAGDKTISARERYLERRLAELEKKATTPKSSSEEPQ